MVPVDLSAVNSACPARGPVFVRMRRALGCKKRSWRAADRNFLCPIATIAHPASHKTKDRMSTVIDRPVDERLLRVYSVEKPLVRGMSSTQIVRSRIDEQE
jgi:hypothetical protein